MLQQPLSQLQKKSEAQITHETWEILSLLHLPIYRFKDFIYVSLYVAINLSRPDIQLSIYPIYKCNYYASKELQITQPIYLSYMI